MSKRPRRVLDEAGGFGAMTWVMAIMVFLTVLVGALGLGAASAARLLDRDLAGRMTVQIVEGDPGARDAAAARLLAMLRATPGVASAVLVDRAQLAALLRPWLGDAGNDPELPVPAMIDVRLADASDAASSRIAAAVHAAFAAARADRHERWMSPVSTLMQNMVLLAIGLVAMMAGATAAVVVLAARAGLEAHRATIEVMHMLGSTDVQLARLFQRRLALDAAVGGAVGGVAALALAALLGTQLAGIGSELLGGITLSLADWVMLALVPVAFVALATLAARLSVLAALRRIL